MAMATLRPTCVSAPGKVLLVGGYLVLDEKFSGLVLASTARFYSQVETKVWSGEDVNSAASSKWTRLFPLEVQSAQFDQLIDGWIEQHSDRRFRFQLRENSHRNSYIEETVLCAVNGIAGLDDFKRKDTFRQLAESKIGVHVTLRGDNDFYSQVQRLQEAKQPLCRSNLTALEPFLPPTMEERGGKLVALKTGMGSSAALVTSLVAALVAFFVPSVDFDKREEDLELVHNLAQLSHCYVQRKIGSGFDVSAACFGSQRYTRFPASILSTFTSENALKPEEIADCITNRALWSTLTRVKPVQLPSSFHLMMGDVSSGSATVSMVRQVLKWQSEQPDHAQKVMNELHGCNMEVEQGFAELCKLENSHGTPIQWELFAKQSCDQWTSTDANIGGVLVRISKAFAHVRELLREMGTSAGVPIEPPEQTAILDAAQAIPGVLVAGVPGAGGYDAICVVVLHECVLQAVEDLWVQWPSAHSNSIICPLLCDVDRGLASSSVSRSGLQLHSCIELMPLLNARKGVNNVDNQNLQSAMRGHQSNMQSIVKRKIREEDDCEADRKVKATYVPQNDEKVSEQENTQQEEYAQCSIPGLRFATESWTGMKTSNEDRHIASTSDFPGPVFGIFDGHGGTFSADFLARQLVKTVSTEIKQKIGARALADMQRLHELSKHESIRRDALVEQIKLLRDQLAEVGAIMSEPASPNLGRSKVSNASDTDDVRDLFDQLTTTILQMDSEVNHIDVEEATRQGARLQWFQRQDNNILSSFKDVFERVDKQILKKNSSQDGSTALLVWFLDHSTSSSGNGIKNGKQPMKDLMFYTVNVGDCRAVMCRGGQGVSLTSDHKPDRPDEKQRIEKAGGFVSKIAGIARVYSAAGAGLALKQETSTYLAVSRAFGDRSLKIPTQLVSCEPEVKRFQLQDDDLFLVMACDGVWDVLSEQEVVDIALPLFRDAKAAADAVIEAAYKKGSVDNLTATVVQFGWKSDAQVQRTIESNKATKSSTPKGRNEEAKVDDSDEEIDMFNL